MTLSNSIDVSAADYEAGFVEVSFLLEILAQTVEEIIGNPAPLGVSAGRVAAAKMVTDIKEKDLKNVLDTLLPLMKNGFEYSYSLDDTSANLKVGHCLVRDLCKKQNEEVGGKLCKLYHHYLAGIMSHLLTRQSRVLQTSAGEVCELEVQAK